MLTDQFNFMIAIMCHAFSASVSSTHRTIDHNRAVGGASDSQHLDWTAADLVLDNNADAPAMVAELKDLGLFAIDETATKNHVHIDDRFNAKF